MSGRAWREDFFLWLSARCSSRASRLTTLAKLAAGTTAASLGRPLLATPKSHWHKSERSRVEGESILQVGRSPIGGNCLVKNGSLLSELGQGITAVWRTPLSLV